MDTNDIFLLLLLISGNINFYEAKNLGGNCCIVNIPVNDNHLNFRVNSLCSTSWTKQRYKHKGSPPNSKMVKFFPTGMARKEIRGENIKYNCTMFELGGLIEDI